MPARRVTPGNVLASAYLRDRRPDRHGEHRRHGARVGRGDGPALVQLVGHTSFVDAVAFSPDGRQSSRPAATAPRGSGTPPPGPAQAQLLGHRGRVTAIAFGPDGTWAVTASADGTARTWSLGSDPQLRTIAGSAEPDHGRRRVGGRRVRAEARADGTVTVRVAGRTADREPTARRSPATSVALSDDGRRLLATARRTDASWCGRFAGGTQIARFELRRTGCGRQRSFRVRRGVVAAGRSGIVRAWDLRHREDTRPSRERRRRWRDVAVSPDASLVATAVGERRARPAR